MNPSKSKGTAAESAVVKYLRSCGIPADRHALKGTADEGDVWAWPTVSGGARLVAEVKAGEQTKAPSWVQLSKWWQEAEDEASRVQDCDMAVLVCKRHGSGLPGDWHAWVRPDDLPGMQGTAMARVPWVMLPLGELVRWLRAWPGWAD